MPVDISNLAISTPVGHLPRVEPDPVRQAERAQHLLKGIAADLIDSGNRVRSGYLRIRTDGEKVFLETQSRWKSGGKTDAKAFTLQLLKQAYQHRSDWATIEDRLLSYFEKSGQRFGTRSFLQLMKVIDPTLVREAHVERDEAHPTLPANLRVGRSRLKLEGVGVAGQASPSVSVTLASSEFRLLAPAVDASDHVIALHATASEQIQALVSEVKDEATTQHFAYLMEPGNITLSGVQGVREPRRLVVGDADGSLCRVLVAGLASGHLVMSPAAMKDLAAIMRLEASLGAGVVERQKFQRSEEIAEGFDRIMGGVRARSSPDGNRLVFIGDLLHDRLSNNKPAMANAIRLLAGEDTYSAVDTPGVIFILGNHDLPRAPGVDWEAGASVFEQHELQWGAAAARHLDRQANEELIRSYFLKAWFDRQAGFFYCHNGIEPLGGGVVRTALGVVHATSPDVLETEMNLVAIGNGHHPDFTNFRPEESAMSAGALGDLGLWQGQPVFYVHGHSGNFGRTDRAVHLNAREDGWMVPIAMGLS